MSVWTMLINLHIFYMKKVHSYKNLFKMNNVTQKTHLYFLTNTSSLAFFSLSHSPLSLSKNKTKTLLPIEGNNFWKGE